MLVFKKRFFEFQIYHNPTVSLTHIAATILVYKKQHQNEGAERTFKKKNVSKSF